MFYADSPSSVRQLNRTTEEETQGVKYGAYLEERHVTVSEESGSIQESAEEYGERVRAARVARRLTQGEAAHLAGISLSTWSKVERAIEPPYQPRILRQIEKIVFDTADARGAAPAEPPPDEEVEELTAAEFLQNLAAEVDELGIDLGPDLRAALKAATRKRPATNHDAHA